MPDVSLKLKEITEDNWMDVVMMSTTEDKEPRVLEEYIASNALSICQAVYEDTWIVKAIYCGRKPVGFTMYGYCQEREEYELCRLMIDYGHQNRGFGSIALKLVIDEMSEIDDCDEIYLLVHKDNYRAQHIYQKHGFVPTDRMVGDEEVYLLKMGAKS